MNSFNIIIGSLLGIAALIGALGLSWILGVGISRFKHRNDENQPLVDHQLGMYSIHDGVSTDGCGSGGGDCGGGGDS